MTIIPEPRALSSTAAVGRRWAGRLVLLALVVAFALGGPLLPPAVAQGFVPTEEGIPALNQKWSEVEYERVAEILGTGKIPLPTLQNDEGKRFFQRLVAKENLAPCLNRGLVFEDRLDRYNATMQSVWAIYMEYMTATAQRKGIHQEMILLLGFALHGMAVGVQLGDEFTTTLPNGETHADREGAKVIYQSTMSLFTTVDKTLGATAVFPPEDLSLLVGAMAEVLPAVKRAFTPEYQAELRKKLEQRRKAFQRPQDAQKIQAMIDLLGR